MRAEPSGSTPPLSRALRRLPGFRPSPHGLEWALWKRLPAILVLGTVVPLGVALVLWWAAPGSPSMSEERDLLLWTYQLVGLVALHWTLVLTAAIACAIVLLMKGPAFVADAYPLPGREPTGAPRRCGSGAARAAAPEVGP